MKKSLMLIMCVFSVAVVTAAGFNHADTGKTGSNKMARPVHFKLAAYNITDSATLILYRDTALMALELLSKVFSSKAFRDSLTLYSFPCSNGKTKPCVAYPRLKARKCDSIAGLIPGSTVYEDLTGDSIINLAVTIKTPVKKSKTIGFSNGCVYLITTYDWWLKSRKDVVESYAVHLAHEYAHVVGYVHNKKGHNRSEDVAYRIGGIVRNIIKQKTQTL